MPRIQLLFPLLRPLATPRRAACQQLLGFSTTTRLRVDQSTPKPKKSTPLAKPATTPSKTPEPVPEEPTLSRAADLAATEAATEADSAQAPAPKPVLPSKRAPSDKKPKKSSSAKDTASPANTKKPADSDSQPSKGAASPAKSTASTPKAAKPTTSAPKPATPKATPKGPPKSQLELPPPKYHVARSNNNNLPIYTDYKRGGNLHLTTIRKITGDLTALRDEMRVFLNKQDSEVKINSLTQHVVIKGFHKAQVAQFLAARGM